MIDSLNDLRAKVDDALAAANCKADMDAVQEALTKAGVTKARFMLGTVLDSLAEAQAQKREADAAERDAKGALDDLLFDIDADLIAPDVNEAGGKLLAADKAAWKKREARKDPRVAQMQAMVRAAEQGRAEAADAVALADRRFKACCADLDAATATLNAMAKALPARKAS